MMRWFDASDEHTKESRGYLDSIGQKFNAHAVLIMHLELQMAQFSTTVKPQQPGSLPRNTIQNP